MKALQTIYRFRILSRYAPRHPRTSVACCNTGFTLFVKRERNPAESRRPRGRESRFAEMRVAHFADTTTDPRIVEQAISQRNLTTSDSEGSFSSLMKANTRTASITPSIGSLGVVVVSVIGALELLIGSGAVAD